MNLPLLNGNLGGFSNACGITLRPLEELLWSIFRSIWLDVSRRGGRAGGKISDDSLLVVRKLVSLHGYLYMGGFASLLSQNSYCATLRI